MAGGIMVQATTTHTLITIHGIGNPSNRPNAIINCIKDCSNTLPFF